MTEATVNIIDEEAILEQKKKGIHEQVTWQFALAFATSDGPGAVTESYSDLQSRGRRTILKAKAYADAWIEHVEQLYDEQKANGDLEEPA